MMIAARLPEANSRAAASELLPGDAGCLLNKGRGKLRERFFQLLNAGSFSSHKLPVFKALLLK